MNQAIDITPEQRKTIMSLLTTHLPNTEAWAYGSRVRWASRPESDLDVVVFAKPEQAGSVSDLREAFEESNLPFRVDLLVWDEVPKGFRGEIEREHAVLDGATTQHASKSDWLETPFADLLTEKVRSGVYKSKQFHGRGAKIINMGELFAYPRLADVPMRRVELTQSEKRRFSILRGDLLFARRSLVAEGAGKCSVVLEVPEPTGFESSIIRARPDPTRANSLFLYYYFNSPSGLHSLDSIRRQVAVAGITGTDLAGLHLRVPPLAQQRQIAHILGTLDDKIELNRRMNETLEAMARAIFKDWFVDFGPTRAKAEGREPYLTPELWDLFPDSIDDQAKPAGWKVRKLEELLDLNYGKSLPARKRTPGNVAVYGSGGVTGTHDTALLEGPAVIVGRKGTVGSLYWEDGPAFPIDTVFYVEPRIGSILFAYHLLASLPLRDMNTDAAVPGLNRNNAYRLEFPLPSPELISAFECIGGSLWKRRAKNLGETKSLAQTRDLLLPKLVSGEVRPRKIEILEVEACTG